jgi:hypothetical protein
VKCWICKLEQAVEQQTQKKEAGHEHASTTR